MRKFMPSVSSKKLLFGAASSLLFLAAGSLSAQVVIAPTTPQIGSSNTVSADPPVTRPSTKPCTVQLFSNLEFADFNTKDFTYTPPAGCKGPWSKVVFTADFTVTAGNQFDRTASFFLGGATLFFGTTAEPRATLSPSWHVESDVTDLSALLKSAQAGTAICGNFIGTYQGTVYNGIIYANAALEFYPASFRDPAPRVPDVVVGLQGNGGAATLNTSTDQLSQTISLPTNVESAYLDVFSESQSQDEFWYFNVPDNLENTLESYGNTGFREAEISIDGQPAGVAPVYPWVYTGGVDFNLWWPIPGVQTLNFKPYRVDLTPFAGVLSNGEQHTVAVSVFNANSYFSEAATLLVYTDHGTKKVTGGVLSNNLAAEPSPVVTSNITTDSSGTSSGPVSVTSNRSFAITGYVNTSHGRVETTVSQKMSFSSVQNFQVNPNTNLDVQDLVQATTVDAKTTTRNGFLVTENEKNYSYPFAFDYNEVPNADGSITLKVSASQQDLVNDTKSLEGLPLFFSELSNHVASENTLQFDASGNLVSSTAGSAQDYTAHDSLGYCYSETLSSADQVLTGYTKGQGCHSSWPQW
jgi:hypothetical protein